MSICTFHYVIIQTPAKLKLFLFFIFVFIVLGGRPKISAYAVFAVMDNIHNEEVNKKLIMSF